MSDINTVAEPKKYRVKFCSAAIIASLYSTILFFSLISNIIIPELYESLFTIPWFFVTSIISALCWVTFTVILFIRKPNILVPISFGMVYILPNFVNIVLNTLYSDYYTITVWSILTLSLNVIATAVCVLFVLKAPAIKAFMKKTALVWIIGIPLAHIALDIASSLSWYSDNYSLEIFFRNLLSSSMEYAPMLLLLLWLSNPYKEVKPEPQMPAAVPQYIHPVIPVQIPVQPVALPVEQPPFMQAPIVRTPDTNPSNEHPPFMPTPAMQVQAPIASAPIMPAQPVQTPVVTPVKAQANASVADEIAKYKALLDNGTITAEEFESLKTKLISRL